MATRTVSNAGGNWNATGTWVGGVVPIAGDDVNFTATSGNLTVNVSTANLVGITFANYVGTITFNNPINTSGFVNLGTGGYTQAGANGINLIGTTTLTSGGVTWSRTLTFSGTSITYTLADNWTVTGAISLSGTTATTINGNTLNISGNLTHTTTATVSGTTAFVFNGTGTWSHTSTGVIRNNTTINTVGTLTIGTNIYYNTGTLTYTAGTVTTTSSTLNIGAATTLNTNGITWNNITTSFTGAITLSSNLTLTGTLSLTSGTLSFTLGGNSLVSTNANLSLAGATFTMPANQTFKSLTTSGVSTINTNTLTVTENLTINGTPGGTTSIVYGGTGTWSGNGFLGNIFTINTAGTLTITGTVNKSGTTFTYTAGTINDTGATVVVSSATTLNVSGKTWDKLLVSGVMTLTSNINATTFGTTSTSNTSFVLGGNSINFTNLQLGNTATTTLPTAWTCTNIEFTNNASGVINGNSITINGNILQSGNGAYSGTTTFTYGGTGTWTATGTGYFSNSFTVNTVGTLTFISANLGAGIFTYTAGTVVTTGSTLYIRANGTTMNHGSIVWYDVITVTNITSFVLNNQLVCSNALTIENSQVTFSGTDGTFDVYYLNLNSTGSTARNPRLVATKTYRVRAGFTSQGTLAFPITLSSTVGGSKAIFTVDPGATLDVGFVNATDIDSSLGKKIYSYKGVFSNTDNWEVLPTDPKLGGSYTFVA
jgi:hypothetical protein